MESEDGLYSIDARLGALSLTVEGSDEEWVRETFEEEWAERMDEAGEMSRALRDGSRGVHQ